jgi:hypothetical protein
MVHSETLPTMSRAPALETQRDREPVFTGPPAEMVPAPVLQSAATSSVLRGP